MATNTWVLCCFVVAIAACGCSSDNNSADAAAGDTSADTINNKNSDSRTDSAPDAAVDSAPDVGVDVAVDVVADVSPDGDPPDAIPADLAADVLPPDSQSPTCVHPQVTSNCGSDWCTIPSGCFVMGSPSNELCHFMNEDQHEVTLSKGFEIAVSEVTQLAFKTRMSYEPPAASGCDDCAVVNVTWDEAAAYCNALSDGQGLTKCYNCGGSGAAVSCVVATAFEGSGIYACAGYRLPTEAEWEYAYRAGTTTAFYNGTISTCTGADTNADAIGWYGSNSSAVAPVKGKTPNDWGLYDMAGNVWEWSHDWMQSMLGTDPVTNPSPSTGTDRTLRGGGWSSPPANLRAADRGNISATPSSDDIGFRCLRTL